MVVGLRRALAVVVRREVRLVLVVRVEELVVEGVAAVEEEEEEGAGVAAVVGASKEGDAAVYG